MTTEIQEEQEIKEDQKEEEDESEISFKSVHSDKQELTMGQKLIRTCYPNANATNIKNSFPLKFFSCCFNAPEELEISDLDSHTGNTYMNSETVNGVQSLFPSKYIRKEEKNTLKFDKPNLIQFFNELIKDKKNHFIRKFEKYDKFGLRMFMSEHNIFSIPIPVTRCQIEIPHSQFTNGVPSVEQIGLAIMSPDKRTKFDKHFKVYKILKTLNDNTETMKIVTNKAMQMIIPREFYEKRTRFEENGIFYSFSSSAPDNLRPPKKEPIRATNHFGMFKIENDGKNIIIDGFYQIDIKIGQPGPLIFMSLPLKMLNFTNDLIKYLNSN